MNYANGVMILHTLADAALDPEYDLLDCWAFVPPPGTPPLPPDEHRLGPPVRVLCGDECRECTDTKCPSRPPLPPVAPASRMHLRVRKAGVLFDGLPMTMAIELPSALGPVHYFNAIQTTALATIMHDLELRIGVQNPPKIFHLFWTEDPRPSPVHLFHQKIIAIPVADEPLTPS